MSEKPHPRRLSHQERRSLNIAQFLIRRKQIVGSPLFSIVEKKTMRKLIISAAAIGLATTHAAAQQLNLRSFLIGKWHQELGPYVTETVLNANGTYTSITCGPPGCEGVEGGWEVRFGNQLWQSSDRALPEGTPIRVVDPDHFQNKLGVAARVR
jgi:hypothetical protein